MSVLATADMRRAGVVSGVNNAVARAASLLFDAAIRPLADLTGDAQLHPMVFLHGFRIAILANAALTRQRWIAQSPQAEQGLTNGLRAPAMDAVRCRSCPSASRQYTPIPPTNRQRMIKKA